MNTTYGILSHETVSLNNTAFSVAVDEQFIYIGGQFTAVQGATRNFLARLSRLTYQVDAMDLAVNNSVLGIHLDATHIYLRGSFTTLTGIPRSNIAQIERTTLVPTALSLSFTGGGPKTWAFRGTEMYIGGTFTHINAIPRNHLGAVDLGTGTITSFDPNVNNNVNSLFVDGDNLLVGGLFTTILGQGRAYLAEINLLTTTLEPQAHFATQVVSLVSTSGSMLVFAYSTAQPVRYSNHRYLSRIDLTENEVLHSPLDINNSVSGVLTDSSRVYLRGSFTAMNASASTNLALLDKATLGLLGSNFAQNGAVNAFALSGGKLYLGGSFTTFGGFGRNRLAVIDTSTTTVSGESANVDGAISDLTVSPNYLFLAGSFTIVNAASRLGFASLTTASLSLDTFVLPHPVQGIRKFEFSQNILSLSLTWGEPCVPFYDPWDVDYFTDACVIDPSLKISFFVSKNYSESGAELASLFYEQDYTGWGGV